MNLSQDEINAMMSGQTDGGDADPTEESLVPEDAASGDLITPEEEAAIIGAATLSPPPGEFEPLGPEYTLTPGEIDTLGEVGNICMGAVATTMYTLLDRRVSITTPRVSVHTTQEVLRMYQVPFVIVEVEYVEGIEGKNMLLLQEPDAAMITDLLMGGDGQVEEPVELNELHMSAINEIMNQMIGASATALSKMLGMPVNISPPISDRVAVNSDVSDKMDDSNIVVKISFDMEIEGLLNSQLLQLIPFQLGRDMAAQLSDVNTKNTEANAKKAEAAAPAQPAPAPAEAAPVAPAEQAAPPGYPAGQAAPDAGTPAAYPGYPYPPYPYPPQYGAPPAAWGGQAEQPTPGNLIDVRPMQYPSFDAGAGGAPVAKSIDMIYDIPLQVSVELGKTKKEISNILEFGVGTVVVLDKVAGDPVEVVVNGKLIARGEVVVIDENYGVRITELLNG